ncbi:TonB-dependent receptor [Sphingomonas sp. NSE70-1]|uniref:TonB-dependent receptor n=1 Tax=Sphingomonas caseinilyticus TaxID=2908205 RepID=A0ABT0RUF2_9SPHN|nr:TonB-dependent receptor [Sphingomonas caseinilyticus]MCL6698325.1 TonB-dependent receptor [Sphingomonas caseinilyticus]
MRLVSLLALSVALAPTPALAQMAPADAGASAEADSGAATAIDAGTDATATAEEDEHHDHHDDIVVTGVRRKAGDVLGGLSVLDSEELAKELRPSLGETLARQPGVSATSFGPAASRPILRGLSGDRIRVLTDGIGSFDVSASSPDHAVAINPLTAERIEVLRGPSALVYGSSAIGGVVNVIDRRIPRSEPEDGYDINGLVEYGSAAEERNANLSVDGEVAPHFVVHADGNWSKSDDLRTGGHLLTKELREEAAASPFPEIQELADLKGELPNTAAKSWELAGGLAYVDGPLNVGVSVTRHDALYGVPIRFSLDPDIEAEAPTIDVKQTRYDARAEIPLSGFFSAVHLRGGYAEYRHNEIEDTGDVASTFRTSGGEGRAELVQTEQDGWSGTSGVQYFKRKVGIDGEEKFLPDSRQSQAGLFTMQSLVRGPLRLEGGVRVEFSKLDADADTDLGTPELSSDFTTFSGSLGAAYDLSPEWRAGLTLSRSARAPSIDELFANGPHAGTQAFEIGEPDLDPEKSIGVEASIRRHKGPVTVTATAYYNHFSNFIFQAATGEIEDDLPVYQYRQGKAEYYGFELETNAELGHALGIHWDGDLIADYVHANVDDFGPAPQIPPFRLLGGISANGGPVEGRLEVEHAFRQNRNAPLETETDGYTLVNASVDWHPFDDRPGIMLGITANNVFDVVARRHSSLLKDYAPLAGRDIRLNARFAF